MEARVRRATGVERERETFGSRFGCVRVCGESRSFRLGRERVSNHVRN